MPFEITLRYSTPLTPVKDVDEVLREFLALVGYLTEAEAGEVPERTVAYRLVRDCFLKAPGRLWYVDELAAVLKTTKPTVYRHLNKLKALDLLEEVAEARDGGPGRKGYRVRYGNLARAWDFVEANATNALKRYRETVDHLQGLLEALPPPPVAKGPKGKAPG